MSNLYNEERYPTSTENDVMEDKVGKVSIRDNI